MASKINADEFVDREGEGKPTLPKGVVLSGVTTITTAVVAENEVANTGGINAGIITSTHFKGNLTGDVNAGIVTVSSQSVIGSGVTISASGIDIGAGVITATSYAGSGANLTGIGATIMIWEYNPDPGDSGVTLGTGIGITFNQKIKAGSGNITLREDSASGTVVENFGIGSSVTISNNSLEFTPTSDLTPEKTYYVDLPSGVITNMAGDSYAGTAYTFETLDYTYGLYAWGQNDKGQLGLNDIIYRSSPTQVPGTTWTTANPNMGNYINSFGIKGGTLWFMGLSAYGLNGQNLGNIQVSSPTQIPGTTWDSVRTHSHAMAVKTDGTLWTWGKNDDGELGQNNTNNGYSSPTQVPGTTWSSGHEDSIIAGTTCTFAVKTDGTLWCWGFSEYGSLGLNEAHTTKYSSPVQIPGTTWSKISGHHDIAAIKTDGTLWGWGRNNKGQLGQNDTVRYSSPVQIPGTTWAHASEHNSVMIGTKTDGTLWTWGANGYGQLGLNTQNDNRSSPVQITGGGTTWSKVSSGTTPKAIKTDGTMWSWGVGTEGQLGLGDVHPANKSSPTQIPGTDWYRVAAQSSSVFAITRGT